MTEIRDLDSILAGGGHKSASFETAGQSYSGVIDSIETRQKTEFGTNKPQFWDDQSPQQQVVVTIQTDIRVDEDDDGLRSVYIKAWGAQLKAFREAAAEIGRTPAKGDHFTVTFTGFGPKPQVGFAPKIYAYKVVAGSPVDAVIGNVTPIASAPSAAAPAAPAADPQAAAIAQAVSLFGLGLSAEQIVAATSLPLATVQALAPQGNPALAAAAAGGTGF